MGVKIAEEHEVLRSSMSVLLSQDISGRPRIMGFNFDTSELKHRWVIRLVLFALATCTVCVSCSEQDDVEAIRVLIKKGASLAEEHDIAGILELASQDLRAMPGDLDRRGTKGVLWRAFRYYGPLKVFYPRPDVEMKEDANQASAQLPFLIVKREQTFPGLEELHNDPLAWLEEVGRNADLYRLRLQLIKQDSDWLVNRAYLERFTGLGFQE